MEPRTAAARVPDPDAADFIRFCYRRRRVGWPELYDEMCAVAARGLFRGLGTEDLAAHGIGFSLFDMPALAAMASGIVSEEMALRRPMSVMITSIEPGVDGVEPAVAGPAVVAEPVIMAEPAVVAEPVMVVSKPAESVEPAVVADRRGERPVRFAAVPAGA